MGNHHLDTWKEPFIFFKWWFKITVKFKMVIRGNPCMYHLCTQNGGNHELVPAKGKMRKDGHTREHSMTFVTRSKKNKIHFFITISSIQIGTMPSCKATISPMKRKKHRGLASSKLQDIPRFPEFWVSSLKLTAKNHCKICGWEQIRLSFWGFRPSFTDGNSSTSRLSWGWQNLDTVGWPCRMEEAFWTFLGRIPGSFVAPGWWG